MSVLAVTVIARAVIVTGWRGEGDGVVGAAVTVPSWFRSASVPGVLPTLRGVERVWVNVAGVGADEAADVMVGNVAERVGLS